MNTAIEYGFKDESPLVILKPIPKPVDEKLDMRAARILEKAQSFKIQNREDFQLADGLVSEGAALIKGIKLIHDPICAATNTAHKLATSTRKILIDPVKQACDILAKGMGNFKILEDRRISEEQEKKAEKARKEQEEAALSQAAELKKEGAPQKVVDAVLDMANTPVQVTEPDEEKLLSRTSFTPSWGIEIINKILVPEAFKIVDEVNIRAAVKAAKGDIKIAGVRIFETFKTRKKAL